MKSVRKGAASAVCALIICILAAGGAVIGDVLYVRRLPARLTATAFDCVTIGAAKGDMRDGKLVFRLFGLFPIRTIDVRESGEEVFIGGTPVGLSLDVDGVVVEDIGTVSTGAGEVAARTTLKKGDIITAASGARINGVRDLAETVERCDGREDIALTVLRAGKTVEAAVTPMHEALSGRLRLGLWLKDAVNGIGTLSFVRRDSRFGALGHAITAGETVVPIRGGTARGCKLLGYTRGKRGAPGEIRGLIRSETLGRIDKNTAYGVFGVMAEAPSGETYPVGSRLDVKSGKAQMYTTIGDEADFYDIEIIRAMPQSKQSDKSMVLRVTDRRLLDTTGGIIQGMSGSPIVQNGRLVGAVTHVFVNDPTKGYGIYLDWMY